MIIHKLLIAGGNATALVQGCAPDQRKNLISALLREVEQVGFTTTRTDPPQLEMMGGEFCINASLAFASTLGLSGRIAVSGLGHAPTFCNQNGRTSITLELGWERRENIILMEGIGFMLLPQASSLPVGRDELARLCTRFARPAFGAIFFAGNAITPFVHVADIDSFVPETACGSGSVAYSIFSGISAVVQPTGQSIMVRKLGKAPSHESGHELFEITAEVLPLFQG